MAWYESERAAVSVEALELAVDLHEAGRNPALVLLVGYEAWRYLFSAARRNTKGRHTDLELVDVLRDVLGEDFDPTWVRQRAEELTEDLRFREGRRGILPSTFRFRTRTPVFMLLCAIADCQSVLGSTTDKLQAWRATQTALALDECIWSDDVLARIQAIRVARQVGNDA